MKRKNEAGQALVVVAAVLTVLIVAAGLAIDVGYLRYQKRRLQTAADSAAIAGAAGLEAGLSNTAALTDAGANGFNDTSLGGTAQVTVTCSSGLQNGFSSTCDPSIPSSTPYVQVSVSQQQPLFFMRIIPGITLPTVSATAVAMLGNGPNCVYALGNVAPNPGGPTGIWTPGAGGVHTVTSCGMIADGPVTVNNGNYGISLQASSIGATAGCAAGCNTVVPAVQTIAPAADPLKYLTSPGQQSITYPCSTSLIAGMNVTLNPGTYPCGIQIENDPITHAAANVTLNPGLYVLGSTNLNTDNWPISTKTCGPINIYPNCENVTNPAIPQADLCRPSLIVCTAFSITGDNNTVTGQGVTFYNATGSIYICVAGNPNPGGQSTGLATGTDGTGCVDSVVQPLPTAEDNYISLTPPTSGDYAGVLFYQDSNNQSQAVFAMDDSSNGNPVTYPSSLQGALYFPSASLAVADLTDNANWQTSTYTILVGNEVSFFGTVQIGNNLSTLGIQPLIKDAILVE